MKQGFASLPLALCLLLVFWTRPGNGNQGSVIGSCSCGKTVPPGTRPPSASLEKIRKHLQTYDRCQFFIRFILPSMSVCGSKRDQWVWELVSCFDGKECGNGHRKSLHPQKHLPHVSTQMPVATEGIPPDTSTLAQIQSTQQSTFPSGALSLTRELTYHSGSTGLTSGYETTALTSGYDPEARPEAKANKEQQEGEQQKEKPAASAWVPVVSLLAIVFLLTAAVVYMLCSRRQTQQSSADRQLHYALVNQDSRA